MNYGCLLTATAADAPSAAEKMLDMLLSCQSVQINTVLHTQHYQPHPHPKSMQATSNLSRQSLLDAVVQERPLVLELLAHQRPSAAGRTSLSRVFACRAAAQHGEPRPKRRKWRRRGATLNLTKWASPVVTSTWPLGNPQAMQTPTTLQQRLLHTCA